MSRRRPRTLEEKCPRCCAQPGLKCKDWKGRNCAPHAVEESRLSREGKRLAEKQLDLFLEKKEDSES